MAAPCPVFGFLLDFEIDPATTEAASERLWNRFTSLIRDQGLVCNGGAVRHTWSHVIHREGSQATDADRTMLEAWARAQPEILVVRAGPLVDLGDS